MPTLSRSSESKLTQKLIEFEQHIPLRQIAQCRYSLGASYSSKAEKLKIKEAIKKIARKFDMSEVLVQESEEDSESDEFLKMSKNNVAIMEKEISEINFENDYETKIWKLTTKFLHYCRIGDRILVENVLDKLRVENLGIEIQFQISLIMAKFIATFTDTESLFFYLNNCETILESSTGWDHHRLTIRIEKAVAEVMTGNFKSAASHLSELIESRQFVHSSIKNEVLAHLMIALPYTINSTIFDNIVDRVANLDPFEDDMWLDIKDYCDNLHKHDFKGAGSTLEKLKNIQIIDLNYTSTSRRIRQEAYRFALRTSGNLDVAN